MSCIITGFIHFDKQWLWNTAHPNSQLLITLELNISLETGVLIGSREQRAKRGMNGDKVLVGEIQSVTELLE